MSDHPRDPSSDDTANPDDHGMAADGSGDHIDAHITAPGIVPAAGEGALRRKTASHVMIMAPVRADDDEPALDFRAHAKSKSKNQDWDGVHVDPVAAAAHGSNGGSGRKTSAIMAVAVVAGIAGALGTAMATAGVSYFTSKPDPAVAASHARALDESMSRIEQDLAALRSNVDRVAKASASQAGKTTDRLDRIEKAQAEPTAKLAKLTDTVEKLRVAAVTPPAPAPVPAVAPPAPAPVASLPAKEVTGSIASKDPASKPEVARLPIVEGWVLLDAGNGGATIESRRGVFDVIAGDPVPGLGRVDAIRRQDGRWVVVTSKGLIVAR